MPFDTFPKLCRRPSFKEFDGQKDNRKTKCKKKRKGRKRQDKYELDHHADLHQRPFFGAHVFQPPHEDESQAWQDHRKRKSEESGQITLAEITKRKEAA